MSSDLYARQIPRSIFFSPLKTAVRASLPEVSFMGIHIRVWLQAANLEEGSSLECINNAVWNCILLLEEHAFYFDIEKQISMRHHCKQFDIVLVVCAPCEHVLFQESLQCESSTILNLQVGSYRSSVLGRRREGAVVLLNWTAQSVCTALTDF